MAFSWSQRTALPTSIRYAFSSPLWGMSSRIHRVTVFRETASISENTAAENTRADLPTSPAGTFVRRRPAAGVEVSAGLGAGL